jgi:predicted enzyme related to lactoylglutathione lyase
MPNPIVHFEIMGKDGKKLQDFYSQLFGWTIDANNPMKYGLTKAKVGDHGIDGGIGQVDQNMLHPYITCYAAVKDIKASLDKVIKLGGQVVVPETVIPNMVTFAMFKDPEGNMFGLVKDVPPGP